MHRKTIQKIALIQWACFQYEIAELKGSTLITGVNGSGKSTILDAITYLLTANIQFNLAAKDRERTVKAYVRGDTKSNGKNQYLRTGEVTSYIAAEIKSEIDESTFVIGVCIESPSMADRCTPYWFILRDTALADVRMAEVQEDRLVVFPRRLLTVKGDPMKLSDFMGRDRARPQILRALGLRCDPEKYRSKLVKMMAFNPENNVDQFIQNCVLDEKYVNSLKELRSQKEKFEEFKGIYENLRISRDKLEVVEKRTAEYESHQRLYLSRSLMLKYQDVLYCKEEKEQIRRRIRALSGELEAAEKQFVKLEEKHERAMERYNTARSNSGYQDISASIEALNTQIRYLNEEIGRNRLLVDALLTLGKEIAKLREKLAQDWNCSYEEEQIYARLGEASLPPKDCRDALLKLTERLEELRGSYDKNKYRLNRELDALHESLAIVSSNLRELENNRIPYPEQATRARDILRAELEKTHRNVQVRFFAELVQEIRDRSWRKAIETFLGRKRFHLVVDDALIGEALHILQKNQLHGTSLVLSDRIPDTGAQKGSAAEILTIPNRSARKYANYLLNGIHLCDTLEELHDHPKGGLMRDGMLAKSYSAATMDMRKTRCYMGMDAVNLQITQYRQERDALSRQEKALNEQLALAVQRSEAIRRADIRARDYDPDAPAQLKKNEEECGKLKEDKEKLESDPGFMQILEEVNRAKAEMTRLQEEMNDCTLRKGALTNAISVEEGNAKTNAAEILLKTGQYEEFLGQYPDYERTMKEDYEKLKLRSGEIRVIKPGSVERIRSELESREKQMVDAQLDYLRVAGKNLEKRGRSFIPFFREEKNEISNVRIEEATEKLHTYAQDMERSFMTDFVAEMNESIQNARREVEAINAELRNLPFGSDTYTFIMNEREDRADFFRICRRLDDFGSMDMVQSISAEDAELSADIHSFMDKLLAEQDESEYTDYRRYFKYDMRIRTRRGDEEIEADFSRKQGSASNGEKQTPYFIILAASLIQCYPADAECARLAFIDEAFAALSRERIEQMVDYLEDNHFQVLYAAPPEKISGIGDRIATTISLVSSGKYSRMIEGLVK